MEFTAHQSDPEPGHDLPQANRSDILAHLLALFPPSFVHKYPDARIEIAHGIPEKGPNRGKWFSAFDVDAAADFALACNAQSENVYVGPALRQGAAAPFGRASDENFLATAHAWLDLDADGAFERTVDIASELHLK